MPKAEPTCPIPRSKVIDLYFMEHRAKLIDIAAYLDRLDRAGDDVGSDFRMEAMQRAIAILSDGQPQRAKRVLDVMSDPTTEPIASAANMKGAHGAWPGGGSA